MDELVRQVAVLQADMAWVKGLLYILLTAVAGLGMVNVAVTALLFREVWRNNRKR